MSWALVVISCGYGAADCLDWAKTYYPTEQECGAAATTLRARLEVEKPPAKVIYYCQEQDVTDPKMEALLGAAGVRLEARAEDRQG